MAGATFSRVKTWIYEKLKASDLNAEFDNILTNFTPAGMDDQSSNVAAMQTTVDPYPAASPSLPTSLAGELQRLRYVLAQITGEAYWYVDPDISLATVNSYILQGQWIHQSDTPTYVSGTQFTVPGDKTATYTQGSRIRATVTAGYVYGTIKTSAYTSVTTITVDWDSGTLDAGLSDVNIGIIIEPSSIAIPPVLAKTENYALLKTDLRREIHCNATSDLAFTVSIGNPALVTSAGHGLSVNDKIVFETTGALPTGLSVGTTYYIIAGGFGADAFSVALTQGGSAIVTSGSQSGTHTLSKQLTITIPTATTIPNGGHYKIKNLGKAKVTLSGVVDGKKNPVLWQYEEMLISTNQVTWQGQKSSQSPDPTGTIKPWPTGTVPAGYLECNGASVCRSNYADLFGVISDDYGAADIYRFNLPDYRGQFLRGWSHGQTTDPDKATRTDRGDSVTGDYVGTKQAGQVQAHTHGSSGAHSHTTTVPDGYGGAAGSVGVTESLASKSGFYTTDSIAHEHASVGGNENRPTNINVMYIIKY